MGYFFGQVLFFLVFFFQAVCVYSFGLQVTFLNVEEGESIFVKLPSGSVYLIDTGNLITGSYVVSFLRNQGVKKISRLIVTHPHPDHAGGIFHILPNFEVLKKFDNGTNLQKLTECQDFYRWYGEIFRKGFYFPLKKGDRWTDNGVLFEVLWPQRLSGNLNDDSLVVKISYGNCSFLLTGDISKRVEKILVKMYGKKLRSSVLKVAHHGAYDATSEEFLNFVSPRYAVISINDRNIRGYPCKKTLQLLKQYNIKTLLTYEKGNINFFCDKNKLFYSP